MQSPQGKAPSMPVRDVPTLAEGVAKLARSVPAKAAPASLWLETKIEQVSSTSNASGADAPPEPKEPPSPRGANAPPTAKVRAPSLPPADKARIQAEAVEKGRREEDAAISEAERSAEAIAVDLSHEGLREA